jgi:mRNA-degrading endonuclease RelE of RelBE toxin-antitoxin system
VTSPKKKWTVSKIANSVRKEIENLDLKLKEEIIKNFECLEYNPFLGDVKKVKGKKNIYRKRIGEYRFYFRTIPQLNNIHILLFKYRGKIKAKTIQRLK